MSKKVLSTEPSILAKTLEEIKAKPAGGLPALMTHVVLGYPSLTESIDLVSIMEEAGVKLVELQIPFSDPIADGPTIMAANECARSQGVKTSDCLKALETIRQRTSIPLLFMSYFNPVYNYRRGMRAFLSEAAEAGCSGLIVPDVTLGNDREDFIPEAEDLGLAVVPIASPLSSSDRLEQLKESAKKSFAYCVSTTATTGAKKDLPEGIEKYLKRAKKILDAPIAVGFGISSPEHVRNLRGLAELAVVGSATIDIIESAKKAQRLARVRRFIASMVKAA